MRVALIAPLVTPIGHSHVGGAQAVVADLAAELARRGHDVTLYASRGSAVAGVSMADVDVDSSALRADLFRAGGAHLASEPMHAAYTAVYEHVRAQRYDAVHNHGFDAPAISVAVAMGVPVVHTLHLPPARGVADAIDDARRRGASVWCAAVSEAHARAWRFVVDIDVVLRNGVPVADIPIGSGSPGRDRALVAARFSPEKGVDDAVAAARDAGWSVDVYGTPYDGAYERAVRGRWSDDRAVRIHDPVDRVRLWDAMGAADAVLCLSRWEEPFGMVAAEAQAAATPVIASRSGGLPEVVRDSVTGHLVPSGDVGAAAAALLGVAALSRVACRRHAEESLSLDRSVDAHEALYARL